MKTLLYVFSVVWFLVGLGALIGGQQLGMGSLQGGMPPPSGGAVPDAASTGWFWLWAFLMPSLIAGALGAILGRLDQIRDAIELTDEQEAPNDKPPLPEERVDPYIGEGYLSAPAETKPASSRQNPTLP